MANFTKRLSRPTSANLEYVRTAKGGWNHCVQGNPTDSQCDALANCVGYACGRFNEIYNEITGYKGSKYPYLNCNAENFIERVQKMYPDLKISQEPMPGAIMVWRKGRAGVSEDGAGHVAIVEEILERDANGKAISLRTSESSWSGTTFFTAVRTYNNGNWVNWANYYFRGFILNPAVIIDDSDKPVEYEIDDSRSAVIGDRVLISGKLYRSSNATSTTSSVDSKQTIVTRYVPGNAHPYNTTGDLGWMDEADVHVLKVKEPKEEEKKQTLPVPVAENKKSNQIYVGDISLRIRSEASTNSVQIGICEKNSYYNCLSLEKKDDYTWYKIGDDAWCAGVDGVIYYSSKGEIVPGEDTPEQKDALEELAKKLKEVETQISSLTSQLEATKKEAQETKAQLEETSKKLNVAENKLASIAKIVQ